ncbi:hypothetical protein PM082_006295 [Marasmius tenuissimus]|nr:hypothetical protein PM082_006295 [Marasmius tenuissimus]
MSTTEWGSSIVTSKVNVGMINSHPGSSQRLEYQIAPLNVTWRSGISRGFHSLASRYPELEAVMRSRARWRSASIVWRDV